jgi:hypothetical protein
VVVVQLGHSSDFVVTLLPHVDQVLCEGDRLSVAGDGDRAVRVAARLAVLAVRNANHRSAQLSGKKWIYFISKKVFINEPKMVHF